MEKQPTIPYDTTEDSCEKCVNAPDLCLRAAIEAIHSRDVQEHNRGVRALVGMVVANGESKGDFVCKAAHCSQRQQVDAHHFVIDPM